MKIFVTTDEGDVLEYTGDDAENMMFFGQIGSDLFHSLPVMAAMKSGSFHQYAEESCTGTSFASMFIRAVNRDTVEDWNALVLEHYKGPMGLTNLAMELANKYRAKRAGSN